MWISVAARNWLLLRAVLAQAQTCKRSDGSGPCCYKVDAGFAWDSHGAPDYNGSPLSGPADSDSQKQPIVHGYALSWPYIDNGNYAEWGWQTEDGGVFNYVEQQQFVFPVEVAKNDEIQISIEAQDGCDMQEGMPAVKYHAMWQGGSSEVLSGGWDGGNRLSIDYATYTSDDSRVRGDPIHITLIPCVSVDTTTSMCDGFDQSRAIAVTVSFRRNELQNVCGSDDSAEGFDCCHVTGSIGPFASQDEINLAVNQSSSKNAVASQRPCLSKPSWQCLRNDTGNVVAIQYKGSLVDFIADSARKPGQDLRIVLDDTVTINLPVSTTYLEYTVDPNAPTSCNSLCDATGDYPSDEDIRNSDGSCSVSAVSSFAAVNEGQLSVSGYGRIDGLPFHGKQGRYFDGWSVNFDWNADSSPGAMCPLCNRFCPLTPYAWGVHALTTACWGNSEGDPLTPTTNSLRSELGDALYHIDSALLEISANAVDTKWAVDIADVTVSNMLKRGDTGVMVQSPGHLVRTNDCQNGGLSSMMKGCQGPNLPAKIYGLKYMGGWHDAVDGPSLKSEHSFSQFMYLHNADDAIKPYSNSIIKDTTVIHGGVGGLVTPCTYNLQSYTPGCYETGVYNTDVVRIMDPKAGYESENFSRGGVFSTRYCAGKTSVGKPWLDATEAPFENNIVDGLVVRGLGSTMIGAHQINQVGRLIGLTVTGANSNDAQVYFCPAYYEPITMHLKTNAFVFKNWVVEVDTYRFDYIDGSGTAKIDTYFAPAGQVVVDDFAVDLRGVAQRITDPAGLNCGFFGYYYACDRSWGFFDSDKDGYAQQCYTYLDGASAPQTFKDAGICDKWKSPRNVQCAGPDRMNECGYWVRVAWGDNKPPVSLAANDTRIPVFHV